MDGMVALQMQARQCLVAHMPRKHNELIAGLHESSESMLVADVLNLHRLAPQGFHHLTPQEQAELVEGRNLFDDLPGEMLAFYGQRMDAQALPA